MGWVRKEALASILALLGLGVGFSAFNAYAVGYVCFALAVIWGVGALFVT